MINYYEVLEVSKNASIEVIEKAYKTLAKKYHPDLQEAENKNEAEEKMKKINEAYEILSDQTKRNSYDEKLEAFLQRQNYVQQVQPQQNKTTVDNKNQANENYVDLNEYMNLKKEEQEILRHNEKLKQELEMEAKRKYNEAYENYLRSLGFKIKYKWTWKRFKNLLIAIIVTIIVCIVFWNIPPVRNLLVQLYEENSLIKTAVNLVGNIVNAILNIFRRS